MNMPYTTDTERRALMADRQRAVRSLPDLIARERFDLAARPARTLGRPRFLWRWTGLCLEKASLPMPILRRPRTLTEECI